MDLLHPIAWIDDYRQRFVARRVDKAAAEGKDRYDVAQTYDKRAAGAFLVEAGVHYATGLPRPEAALLFAGFAFLTERTGDENNRRADRMASFRGTDGKQMEHRRLKRREGLYFYLASKAPVILGAYFLLHGFFQHQADELAGGVSLLLAGTALQQVSNSLYARGAEIGVSDGEPSSVLETIAQEARTDAD